MTTRTVGLGWLLVALMGACSTGESAPGGKARGSEGGDADEPLRDPVLRAYQGEKVVEVSGDGPSDRADGAEGKMGRRARESREEVGAVAASPAAPPTMAEPAAKAGAIAEEDRPSSAPMQALTGVKSGKWNDNANWRDYVRYLGTAPRTPARDVSSRRFVVVTDADGKPVPNCQVALEGEVRTSVVTTTSSGRALFFPRADGFSSLDAVRAVARCGDADPVRVDLGGDEGVIRLSLAGSRELDQERVVDLAFVLDTTGSMSEEIRALADTIEKVADMLEKERVTVRLALVEYKDRTDRFVTATTPFTRDVRGFLGRVRGVSASGGGDTPEDVNEGLRVAMDELSWSERSVARMAFVIGDAPPQLGYQNGVSYADSARRASERGVVLHTVAASGMDPLGQSVFRQLAQSTGGSSFFVMRGGAGPQSVGGGDPASSCGGTHESYRSGDLHRLVTDEVYGALAALDADPLRIPGLGRDEDAAPCDQRIQPVTWRPR